MGNCFRCGASGEMEYGSDGMPYCTSCIFYGLNKQCFRCRMYLPATELQQYRGSVMCPYCIRDMREEDVRAEAPHEKGPVRELTYPETCERCGRNLGGRVYIWNGKRLCRNCLESEQETWGVVGGGPSHGAQLVSVMPFSRARRKSLLEALISDILALLGLKKKEPQIILVGPHMPIELVKPLAEAPVRKNEKSSPENEGIMGKKQKKGGNVVPGKKKI
jgi:hypothetical protein